MNAPAPTELLKIADELKTAIARYPGSAPKHLLEKAEAALRQAASVGAEVAELREQLHYMTGTCELAMKHRDIAEHALEAALGDNPTGPIEKCRWIALLERAEAAEAKNAVGAEVAGEAVAWRVRNDFGHWHATCDRALASTWHFSEGLFCEPLYLASPSRSEGVSKGEVRSEDAVAWQYRLVQSGDWSEWFPTGKVFHDAIAADIANGKREDYQVRALYSHPAQAPSKQLSDFAELKLLIDEYDPANSDWNFRRGVLLDVLVRLWPQASPVPSAQPGDAT